MIKQIRLLMVSSILGFGLLGQTALAKTSMTVGDGGQVDLEVSLQHPTRISFKYDGGEQLIFNQPEGATPEVTASVDEKGDVYLSVLEGSPGQMVSGFLTTEGGRTYLIRLEVKDKHADQYEIISKEAKAEADKAKSAESAQASASVIKPVSWSKESGYHHNIAALMRALYFDAVPEGFVAKRTRETKTVDGLMLKTHRIWTSENMEAVVYDVRNDNAYFVNPAANVGNYRPYVAVSFTTDALEAGQSCKIYLLRKKAKT